MMTLNSVSTSTPKADEGQQLPVIAQIRLDEAVDGGHRAGGFLGGEDDEVLVIIIVVELQLVVLVVLRHRRRARRAGLPPARADGSRLSRELLRELRIVRRREIRIIR